MPLSTIVVTHDVADFDAVAGSVAATKLHAGAVMIRRRLEEPTVRAFLQLHRDRFPMLPMSELDQRAVERLIVVDVRRRSRLADFPVLLERAARGVLDVHVYDHHDPSEDDLAASVEHVEPLGAVTTMLVERIRTARVPIDPIEATLFALGIHVDTGSLTFGRTTARDAGALAWLLERGAHLAMIQRYVRPSLDDEQRRVLIRLLEAAQVHRVGGSEVGIAVVPLERAPNGLAAVVSEACELASTAALVAILPIGRGHKIQVIGRSRDPSIDVGAALRSLGGGGHPGAASATVRGTTVAEIHDTLLVGLEDRVCSGRRVRDLMSTPVFSLSPELSLREAERRLCDAGHRGAPVLRDGALAGIVSLRDIARAAVAGTLDLPCSSYMSAPVHTIEPEATLERALRSMVRHGLGRLVVVDDGRIAGLVSRTDVLRALYGATD